MNVFRGNCYSCIYYKTPICELHNKSSNDVLYSGRCEYTPVHNENEAILQIYPKDKHIIQAILGNETITDVFEDIITNYIQDKATIYWNIINGKLYLTVKIKQELEKWLNISNAKRQ